MNVIVTLIPTGTMDGSTSHDSSTIGGGTVGGGGLVGGKGVLVALSGIGVGDFRGPSVGLETKSVFISVGVKVAIGVLVRNGVRDGRGEKVGLGVYVGNVVIVGILVFVEKGVAVPTVFSIGTSVYSLVSEAIKSIADILLALIFLYPIMQASITSNTPPILARIYIRRLSNITAFNDCLVEISFSGCPVFSDRYCDCCGLITDKYINFFVSII